MLLMNELLNGLHQQWIIKSIYCVDWMFNWTDILVMSVYYWFKKECREMNE